MSTASGQPAHSYFTASLIVDPFNSRSTSMAAAVAKADVPPTSEIGSPISVGVSAAAQSLVYSSGRASATARVEWIVNVVINPFAHASPIFGQALYQQMLDRFGCDGSTGLCPTFVNFTTAFQHQTTGAFMHSETPFHEGVASFSESVTIRGLTGFRGNGDTVTFAGSADYRVRQTPGSDKLTGEVLPTSGWTQGDFDPLISATMPATVPPPMWDTGPIAGERLFALRQASLNSLFELSWPTTGGVYLPMSTFKISMEQSASASFVSYYGWGSVAADFDDTALTSVMSLIDPTGEFNFDPSMIEVHITAVPEPSKLMLMAAGLGLLMLARARRQA